MSEEQWEWRRAVSLSPNRVGKDHVLMFRMILYIVVWAVLAYGGYSIYKAFDKGPQLPDNTTVAEGGVANIDKSETSVVHNHFPLSDLFSFGSKGKMNKD